jgi:hypothetical protein
VTELVVSELGAELVLAEDRLVLTVGDSQLVLDVDDPTLTVDGSGDSILEVGTQGPPGASPNVSIYDDETIAQVGGVLTIDVMAAATLSFTLTQNVTSVLVVNRPPAGRAIRTELVVTQDGVGGRTIIGWPAGTKSPGGINPGIGLSASPNAEDVLILETGATKTKITLVAQNYLAIP